MKLALFFADAFDFRRMQRMVFFAFPPLLSYHDAFGEIMRFLEDGLQLRVTADLLLDVTIRQRQTCFCGAFRSLITPTRRQRSAAETVMEVPVRMHQTRTLNA